MEANTPMSAIPYDDSGPLKANLLLVEDEAVFARAVKKRLERAGHQCIHATTLAEARDALRASAPDLVVLDLKLPDGSGMDFLPELAGLADGGKLPVIMLTAYGEIGEAVAAMKSGAVDFLRKPIDLDELQIAIDQALQTLRLRHQLDYSRQRDSKATEGVLLLGESVAMRRVREQLKRLATLTADGAGPQPTVLILGETGTGKDVAARLLHSLGPRQGQPFVQIDCASLPKDLIEAELFGHEKGAYTGAHGARVGLIEAAEEGTLFLDEIGELPLDLQAKLLNVIERRKARRLGSVREIAVGARFVAGTNRNLPDMIEKGQFRSDLYFRLNVMTVTLPPLRERGDDVALLANHFALQTSRRYGLQSIAFSEEAMQALQRYPWPGNVRELKHLIERALLLSHGNLVQAVDLGLNSEASVAAAGAGAIRSMTLEQMERHMLEQALRETGNNVSEAARKLGVSRMTMRYRMEKYGLKGKTEM